MLCCWETSLWSCGPATKSRTLGLWLTLYPLALSATEGNGAASTPISSMRWP
jgi:hypothetical protein